MIMRKTRFFIGLAIEAKLFCYAWHKKECVITAQKVAAISCVCKVGILFKFMRKPKVRSPGKTEEEWICIVQRNEKNTLIIKFF